jgi:NitT/TauT family transport system substrate-binding protein
MNGLRLASRQAARDSTAHAGRAVTRWRQRAVATLGAAVALLAVSVAAGGAATATAGSLETVTIVSPPFEPTALAFYADARGFFRKHGIEADVKVVEAGPTIAAAIASGTATFGPSDIGGFLNAKSRGAPLKLVAAGGLFTPQAQTAALVSAPGKRVASARDLVGKRVGVDRTGSIAHVALLKWLKRGGVRVDDVELAFYAFPDMIGPLSRGAIDAAVLPEPWLTQAKQQGATLAARVFASVCTKACLWTIWVARSDVDRALAARFRNAIQEAAVWANRKESRVAIDAILARRTELPQGVIRSMTHSMFATRLRLARTQPWIDVYKEFELIPPTFTAPDLVK